MRSRILLSIVLAATLGFTGCKPRADQVAADAATAATWSSIIAGHTNGSVSRKSEIRVLFQADFGPDANKPGADKAAVLEFEPAIRGSIEFIGKREIVFHPTAELMAGQTYTVRVLPAGLANMPAGLAPFEFRFSVQSPQFDVSVQALESDPADDARMILRGLLVTADAEDPARVEKLATLSHLDAPVALQWTHDADNLKHRFTSASLPRQKTASNAVLRWSGQAIGASNTGELSADIPARGAFTVADAQALDAEGRRQIVITFSDALARSQNLSGLVRLGDLQFTTQVANNLLTIYPGSEVDGAVTVTLEPGIRNQRGQPLEQQQKYQLEFTSTKPQVRWVGKGVILPDNSTISIPFEAVSARSVNVLATRIYEDNVAQFLQVNGLDGEQEMGRVGRVLWRKKIDLTGPRTGRWQRYSLEVGELLRKYPRGMFQLTLQITPTDSDYRCDTPLAETNRPAPQSPANQEDSDTATQSNWDFVQQYYGGGGQWEKRNDPCDVAYFQYADGITASRNLLASNIGLLAKRDQRGQLLIMATDLRSAKALPGVKLSVRNYQNQEIGSATSDGSGLATLTTAGTPYLLVAEANNQRGYLKLAAGAALPISHFDVGGETVSRGIKGFIYGDRGVWRPGDTLYLTFVLQDKEQNLPADHPVTLELYDPSSRLVQSQVNTRPIGGFYAFTMQTNPAAPTGNWTAKAVLGGSSFTKRLKIETVMPNRLKISLDLGKARLGAGKPIAGSVSSQWLSGATAAGLKADVSVRLTPTATAFSSFSDFSFDDPARRFAAEPITVFEGTLDDSGNARFDNKLKLDSAAPGMLSATFTTRVFERGGAFSILRDTLLYAPYENFVGVRLPKGDVTRDMLLTDQDHTLEIASLDTDGKPVSIKELEVTLYKVEWRWWWDKGADSLAQYVEGQSNSVVRSGKVATSNGRGAWKFRVNYPDWGRYLLRVCDPAGGHCSGRTFYIDWPAWAGKEREQSGPAANVLTVTADKAQYQVGETATLQLPESAQGRALITIENGTRILDSRWLEPKAGNTRFQVPVTAAMTPNVYVAVTLVQPHADRNNDRPLRLYGIVPLLVNDPATRLSPRLTAADEWKPESRVSVDVAEANGRAMTYTIAVVDEGLLSLTNFRTPDLHGEFYKREALGISTWDLFDQVAGSYSAQLERLLALGGSDAAPASKPDEKKSRFPPVVRFLGPFQLKAGARPSHPIELPQYVGAVRVMVVAGDKGAYGTAEKSVFVRQPLMLLPTLPRVAGPGEEILVPVSLFVTKPGIKDVTLSIDTDGLMQPVGDRAVHVLFDKPDERIGLLRVRTGDKLGQSRVRFAASGGGFSARGEIYIEIRSPNPLSTRYQNHLLQPGESWSTTATPFGLAGTNKGTLELSAVPPLNLDARLRYLIQYPHGCLEQTTSAVFPQLYLSTLLALEDGRKRQIEENVHAAIERLRFFQLANGAFSYWPGASGGFTAPDSYESWSSSYATHFLIEAEKAGYSLPGSLRSGALRALKAQAASWTAPRWQQARQGSDGGREAIIKGAAMGQAYRLYVLALAGAADVGAMNRLREVGDLPAVETWTLAAAYKLAGLPDIARAMTAAAALTVRDSSGYETFGSPLRDRAMLLQSLVTLGRYDRTADLVRVISTQLSSESWYSTQETAYSLMAMARFAGNGSGPGFTAEVTLAGSKPERIGASKPVYQRELGNLPANGQGIRLRNDSQRVLFATLALRGIPAAGRDAAESAGLALEVSYMDMRGTPVDVTRVTQGTDLVANITVRNLTPLRIDNIALAQMVPAGWEIHNDRMDNAADGGDKSNDSVAESSDGIPVTRLSDSEAQADHTDIRDDRVLQYFGLRSAQSIRFRTRVNAAYVGRFYLPSVSVEAMYDASKFARSKGQWVQVAGQPR